MAKGRVTFPNVCFMFPLEGPGRPHGTVKCKGKYKIKDGNLIQRDHSHVCIAKLYGKIIRFIKNMNLAYAVCFYLFTILAHGWNHNLIVLELPRHQV